MDEINNNNNIWDYNLQNVSCKWLVNAHMIAIMWKSRTIDNIGVLA